MQRNTAIEIGTFVVFDHYCNGRLIDERSGIVVRSNKARSLVRMTNTSVEFPILNSRLRPADVTLAAA